MVASMQARKYSSQRRLFSRYLIKLSLIKKINSNASKIFVKELRLETEP
jgi:hypothetical protein